MAGITQTVPSFALGISEQPDHLKFPGQVTNIINAIPDVTKGLFKRPGAKRIGADALSSVQTGGSWFHYHRDETEGSYIGQVAADGQVRVWRCTDGQLMTTVYGTGGQTAIQNYLATSTPENLQFLTINDTTFVNNRDTTNANTLIGMTGTTTARPHPHFGFIELLRTENGRQYAVNISDNSTGVTLTRATRIEIVSDTLDESDGTGHCPGIGTQVFTTDYSLNTAATFTTSNVDGGTNNLVVVTVSAGHGLQTGNTVSITSSESGFDNLPNVIITRISDTVFQYVADSDQGSGGACTVTHSRNNLIFRINTLGQQGVSPDYSATGDGPDGDNYRCSYNREAVLLHGGEGWVTNNEVTVTLTAASGGGQMVAPWNTNANYTVNQRRRNKGNTYKATGTINSGQAAPTHTSGTGPVLTGGGTWEFISDSDSPSATYTIRVIDHETTIVQARMGNTGDGLVRPAPTPFDADTAVTADTILGGIKNALPSGVTGTIIGTGMYLSSTQPFNVEVVEDDLMRCFQGAVNDVTRLPNQCKHGYIVQVTNSQRADEDDYFLRFENQNSQDGVGSWIECAKPGILKTLTNMPLVIQRTALTEFTVKQFTYEDRRVGDTDTNPDPSFVGSRINKVLFFRNRLAMLSGESVILCRPGTVGIPDFFIQSALTVSATDPIDIACSSTFPSELFDGIEINTGLLVFSTNQQFLLSSDDTVLNPDTAKLRSVSTFNYNKAIAPISLGTTVAYVDNSGKFSRFNEMANVRREGEPNVVEVSKIVPSLLLKDIDLLTNSRENSIVLLGKTNSDIVTGYKYFQVADKRSQAAWFKWKLNNPLIYHFIINDQYFFLDSDYYLQSINLIRQETDPTTTQNDVEYLLHLDNNVDLSGGSFDSATNTTTFSGLGWLNTVTTPNYSVAVVSPTDGRYQSDNDPDNPMVSGTTITLNGDWSSGTYKVGYVYDYEVELPTLYPTRTEGSNSRADINSSLVIHRVKFHFGTLGSYKAVLKRVGKNNYEVDYESTPADAYVATSAPYITEFIKTVPVYERNTNLDIILRSTHPAPATLRGLSWEGDYSPRFYKRV